MISDYDVIEEYATENDRLRKEINGHKRTRMQLILSAFVIGYMTCYLIDRLVLA